MTRRRKRIQAKQSAPRHSPTPLASNRTGPKRPRFEPSLEGMMGLVVGGMAIYIFAEMSLQGRPHPAHWFAAALGALFGFMAGELVHHQREPF